MSRADNLPVQPDTEQPPHSGAYRWRAFLSWRVVPTFAATVIAVGGVAKLTEDSVVAMAVGVAVVAAAWAWVVWRLWRACVILTSTTVPADTVVVRGWFRDRRFLVSQVMEVKTSQRYGPEIRLIDGREIAFVALTPPWFGDKSYARQRDLAATLTRAARAACAAHPEEAAAAVAANAPLRARRDRRRTVLFSVMGLGVLVAGLVVPDGWPLAIFGGLLLLLGLGVLYAQHASERGH